MEGEGGSGGERGLGEKGGGEGIDQLRTILRTGIPEYSCLCVSWEILSDASNETVFKCSVQVDEPDRKWCHSMGLYSPDSQIEFNFFFLSLLLAFLILLLPFGLRNAEKAGSLKMNCVRPIYGSFSEYCS